MSNRIAGTISTIMSMNSSELNAIVAAVNKRRNALTKEAASQWMTGDKVKFNTRDGGVVVGVITKVNRKTINVVAESGMPWRVSPQLLDIA